VYRKHIADSGKLAKKGSMGNTFSNSKLSSFLHISTFIKSNMVFMKAMRDKILILGKSTCFDI
jgi:hypothetical protein